MDFIKVAAMMMFRTSKKYFPVMYLEEINVNGVSCLKLRLEQETAVALYGASCIPIISSSDLLKVKFIRFAH